jgi:hypothetical protein
MKTEVKDQMIKEIEWSRDYHARKVQEENDKLEVLGVEPSLNLERFMEKIKTFHSHLERDDIKPMDLIRSIMYEINNYEQAKTEKNEA